MKPVLWLRIAAVLTLLLAAGHTFGFLTFRAPTLDGQAVFALMNHVTFSKGGTVFSYGGFYRGFGFFVTVLEIFLAWLLWVLSRMAKRGSSGVVEIAWGIVVLQVVCVVLSVVYFAAAPAILYALVALSTMLAALPSK